MNEIFSDTWSLILGTILILITVFALMIRPRSRGIPKWAAWTTLTAASLIALDSLKAPPPLSYVILIYSFILILASVGFHLDSR